MNVEVHVGSGKQGCEVDIMWVLTAGGEVEILRAFSQLPPRFPADQAQADTQHLPSSPAEVLSAVLGTHPHIEQS